MPFAGIEQYFQPVTCLEEALFRLIAQPALVVGDGLGKAGPGLRVSHEKPPVSYALALAE